MGTKAVDTNVTGSTGTGTGSKKADTSVLFFKNHSNSSGDTAWAEVYNANNNEWYKMDGTVVENQDTDSSGNLAIAASPAPVSNIRLNASVGEWSLHINQ